MFGRMKTVDVFDWKSVPEVDAEELKTWLGATDKVERRFPLAVALQVHDELERTLMSPRKLDAAELSEIRGGLKALARFAQTYSASLRAGESPLAPFVPEDEDA